jgi:protoporphyrinogen oxidase
MEYNKLGLFKKSEVRKYYLLKKKNVYPVYDINYLKNIKILRDYLDQFENLYYIGRPGRFQYTNQDHSLEMGIMAAKSIIERKKYDFDEIGNEKEYFESGIYKL